MHPDLKVLKDVFGASHMWDLLLKNAREQDIVVNGVSQVLMADESTPHFVVNKDLLYRVTKVQGKVVDQLLPF